MPFTGSQDEKHYKIRFMEGQIGVRQITILTEKEIIKIWQRRMNEGDGLATEDGQPLKIVFPGRPNDEQGADFHQAVIVTGGRLVRGDVEVHIKSSGWYEHHHDTDPEYSLDYLSRDSPYYLENRLPLPSVGED